MNITEALNQIESLRESVTNNDPSVKITAATCDLMEKVIRNMGGDYSKGRTTVQEALTSTDTVKLIPKIIEGQMREAAEPVYLATQFMTTVNFDSGNTSTVYQIPIVGEIQAYEVGEGSRYNETNVDFGVIENAALEIRVKKIGCRVTITEEAISDGSWDILGINVRKVGRAMARFKEEWAFREFSSHGHTAFDNNLRAQSPEAGTTGRDADGNFNDTLSVEDFIDLIIMLMGNGFNPTDVIMHPLIWIVFARNSMIGNGLSYGALGGQGVNPNHSVQGTPAAFSMASNGYAQPIVINPSQVQNRLPMPVNVMLSPFIRFDKLNKQFDMYCVDRNEVGIIAQKERLTNDNWSDPERDIRNIKAKERYGIGVLNDGKAITVCRNIAAETTYPTPPTVRIQNDPIT